MPNTSETDRKRVGELKDENNGEISLQPIKCRFHVISKGLQNNERVWWNIR